tara:strand:- start:977 stop:1324 length:348 start_codon:yes stop_codon:yes gene_type:complete
MALETKIWINKLNVQHSLSGLDNVVVTIDASMSGRETTNTNKRNFVYIEDEEFTISAPISSSFIEFAELKRNDCINFVKSSDHYSTIYEELTSRIQEQQPSKTQSLCAQPYYLWE